MLFNFDNVLAVSVPLPAGWTASDFGLIGGAVYAPSTGGSASYIYVTPGGSYTPGPPVYFGFVTDAQLLAIGANTLPLSDPGVALQIYNSNGILYISSALAHQGTGDNMSFSYSIVNETVTQQQAPTPSLLQQTGALLSHGGTNTSPGTMTLLTQASSFTPYQAAPLALTSLVWASSVVTATAAAPHGYTVGDTLYLTIAGAVPTGYNGNFLVTITSTTAFTYPLAANPGTETTPGTFVPLNANELLQMVTTFFGQGTQTGVYILELGPGNANDSIAYFTAWLVANPGIFYGYLTPREWDANPNFLNMLAAYESTTAKVYWWVTTTLATWTVYTSAMKNVRCMIEAPAYGTWPANPLTAITYASGFVTATTTTPHGVAVGQWFQIAGVTPSGYNGYWQAVAGTTGSTLVYAVPAALAAESILGTLVVSTYASAGIPSTEFSHAADFQAALSTNPSSTQKVAPFNRKALFGVTQFPVQGNSALLTTLLAGNIAVCGSGIAGGLAGSYLWGGNMMDGRPWNYWYAADWVQINVSLNVNADVFNGSNSTANPLYYNQLGIDREQAVAASTMSSGVTFGMVYGTVAQTELDGPDFATALNAGEFAGQAVVNAVPIGPYLEASPGDYKIGQYAGYTISFVPLRGFERITFGIIVSDFVAP